MEYQLKMNAELCEDSSILECYAVVGYILHDGSKALRSLERWELFTRDTA